MLYGSFTLMPCHAYTWIYHNFLTSPPRGAQPCPVPWQSTNTILTNKRSLTGWILLTRDMHHRHRLGARMHLVAAVVHQHINPSRERLLLAALFLFSYCRLFFFHLTTFYLTSFFIFYLTAPFPTLSCNSLSINELWRRGGSSFVTRWLSTTYSTIWGNFYLYSVSVYSVRIYDYVSVMIVLGFCIVLVFVIVLD